jgi:hypothetical protein
MPPVTNPYMKHTFSPASDNWGFTKFMEKYTSTVTALQSDAC